ncbi:MAG: SGNH/GDSL hydrolase family protein [Planctomycetaceae bacterium]|jgi:lysophospholipase L1-like esterase|nr:SGNH/GDSL hydrolase family protein [Planctomycetaceae bacterium]
MLKQIPRQIFCLTLIFVLVKISFAEDPTALKTLEKSETTKNGVADTSSYLDSIKQELQKKWSKNRTINFVFHGHSVPAGYFKTPEVRSFQAYPLLVHQAAKEIYPFAVVNAINTSIGGEQSESGAARFQRDVLTHQPDVIFIDYALNDRSIGLERAKKAWESMIKKAIEQKIKIILLTPTPDWSANILDENASLSKHASQIRELAAKYNVGLVDSYAAFQEKVKSGENVRDYLSQINHPNEKGHKIVTELIMQFLKNNNSK